MREGRGYGVVVWVGRNLNLSNRRENLGKPWRVLWRDMEEEQMKFHCSLRKGGKKWSELDRVLLNLRSLLKVRDRGKPRCSRSQGITLGSNLAPVNKSEGCSGRKKIQR